MIICQIKIVHDIRWSDCPPLCQMMEKSHKMAQNKKRLEGNTNNSSVMKVSTINWSPNIASVRKQKQNTETSGK